MSNFKLTPVDVITRKQYKNNWLIKDVMESKSIGMLFGAPASAKSFIAMDIAFCIATGIDWNGNKTKHGNVVYLAGEGSNGLGMRFKALEHKYETTVSKVYISSIPTSLSDSANIKIVSQEIQKVCSDPALIIIDTLHRNLGHADENSSRDIAAFLFCITELMNATGATVLMVHHSGHGSSDRARGSSSIKAALDFEYKAVKKDDSVTMSCTKAKEFTEPAPMSFDLVAQPIVGWFDDDGKPVESAILEPTAHIALAKKPTLNEKDRKILQLLMDEIGKTGQLAKSAHEEAHPTLAAKKYVYLDTWRNAAYPVFSTGGIKPGSVQQAFARSKSKLISETKILVIEDCCYCLD
jgi:hypothetical protein